MVDSSALLTLLDTADPRHDAARLAFERMAGDTLVTHGQVVAETLAVARRRFGVPGAVTLIDDLLPVIAVLPVGPAIHEAALRAYRASLPSGTSFVDHVTLAVVRAESIPTVFALDPDLAASGAEIVPSTSGTSDDMT
jgi:predicted nucleic acid-binding protein